MKYEIKNISKSDILLENNTKLIPNTKVKVESLSKYMIRLYQGNDIIISEIGIDYKSLTNLQKKKLKLKILTEEFNHIITFLN